jgi:putative transposase
MTHKIDLSVGEFYHIYNRGVDKRIVYQEKIDYCRFIALLYLCNSTKNIDFRSYKGLTFEELFAIERGSTLVNIGAYCLMPNHFHLLLQEKKPNGISLFMQKLLTAYTMYFNKKNERTGALFAGTYKITHANYDEYLKYLFSYIHLNPIKLFDPDWKEYGIQDRNGSLKFLNSYLYSSFPEYSGKKRSESVILQKDCFPDYFDTFKEFNNFIKSRLNFRHEG